MRRQTLVAVTVVIALAACSRRTAEARASSASTSASGAVEITDDQIERFIAWSREWGDLARKHYEEGAAVSKRVADKYMPDLSRMSDDPELRATLDRQRAEMQEHMNRCPLNDAQVQAYKAVCAGILPQHNEKVLSAAREKYGDTFVDRVLAHEREISANYPR